MKYQIIDTQRSKFRLGKMCQVLEVSRSGYYNWKKRELSQGKISNDELFWEIKKIYYEQEQIPGSPKITEELKAQGIKCSKNRVAKIMKENGIASKIKKKFQKTTNSNHNSEIVPNILVETEKTNAPNQAWISDITYIWIKAGWLYLVVIIDVFNRGVIGWSISNRIIKELVISAFLMAVFNKNPGSGVVFHSDRGSQYVSNEFKVVLKSHHFIQSMSGAGNCYDNAMAESFFHSLKVEKIYWNVYETREQAKQSIFEYIEL